MDTEQDKAVSELLGKQDHKRIALWAADCAEHVLHYFEEKHPGDERPRRAVEAGRAWARGEISVSEARAAALKAHAAAREANRDANREANRGATRSANPDANRAQAAARAAARAAGHAAATAHVASHAVHAGTYAAKAAAYSAADPAGASANAAKECDWQLRRLRALLPVFQ